MIIMIPNSAVKVVPNSPTASSEVVEKVASRTRSRKIEACSLEDAAISDESTGNSTFDETYLKMSLIYNTPVIQRLRITGSLWRGQNRNMIEGIEQTTETCSRQEAKSQEMAEGVRQTTKTETHHQEAVQQTTILWQNINGREDLTPKRTQRNSALALVSKGRKDRRRKHKQLRGKEKFEAIPLGEDYKCSREINQHATASPQDKTVQLEIPADWLDAPDLGASKRVVLTKLSPSYLFSACEESRPLEPKQSGGKLRVRVPTLQSPKRDLYMFSVEDMQHTKPQRRGKKRLPSLGSVLTRHNEMASGPQKIPSDSLASISPTTQQRKRCSSNMF